MRETRQVALAARRLDPGRPLVRRLPRPRAVLLGRVRRPQLRRRAQPDQPGGHHLHDLPRDHQRQQHPRQRRLHDRRAPALSLRLQRRPALAVDQQRARQGQARDAQEDVPEADHQGRSSSARPATRSACPYGVNHYKDFVRGQNHYDPFLLSGVSGHGAQSFYYPDGGQDELQRVPHGAEAVDRLRRQGLRRQGRPRDPRPPVPRRQHRAWPPSWAIDETAERHAQFLQDKKVRVDIFGLRDGGVDRRQASGPAPPRRFPPSKPGEQIPGRGRRPDARRSATSSARARSIPTRSGSS